MKKFLCIFLSLALVFSMGVTAFSESTGKKDIPVIMVAGYSSSKLKMINSDGSEESAWGGIEIEKIISTLFHFILSDKDSIKKLTDFSKKQIIENAGNFIYDLFGHLAFDDNGESINNIDTYIHTPEESCTENLINTGRENLITEPEIQAKIAELSGGYSNLFTFNVDFRMGTVSCAEKLNEFIDSVLEYTGSDKVNIYAVSHGGQTVATYLSLYGSKKCVNNAVLTIPAIGGAALAYDILSGNASLDEENLVRFVEHGMMFESDFEWLVQNHPLDGIDEIIKGLLPYLYDVLGNWGSIWDFIPYEYYDEVKAQRLDETVNAEMIKKSDYVHYQLMPSYADALQKARDEYDVNVSIVAGTDNDAVTGLQENSDSIITTNASTGAVVAPYGMRFSDGYTAINGDNSYVSPSMTVDASTAYLPDNTWFIDGLFHGMTLKDKYSIDLAMKLLLTDELENVYSDVNYPRFRATSNKSSSVFFSFDNAPYGIINKENTKLTITNLSEKYNMTVLAVNSKGLGNIMFKLPEKVKLAPGESITVEYTGELKEESKTSGEVTVSYLLAGSISPVNERTLYFALDNGAFAEYDSDSPFVKKGVYSDECIVNNYFIMKFSDAWFAKLFSLIINILSYFFASLTF